MKSWYGLMFAGLIATPGVFANDNPDGQLAAKVEAARSYTEAQRKAIVMKNLDLGKDETAAFWPVYRDYRSAMAKIQDERVKIIADYAENYRSMTGDKAKSLLEGYIRTDEDVLKLKRQYLSKFRKGLPETKVARYYQIENKMDALVAADLALQIPLVLPTAE
jgi:hypothetical protein